MNCFRIIKFSVILILLPAISLNAQVKDSSTTNKIDTTKIRIGKKDIQIISEGDETYISVTESKNKKGVIYDFELDEDDINFKKKKSPSKFKGHWSGLEIGLNNYIGDNTGFMSLNTTGSINLNWNMFQYSFGIIKDNIGLVTGLGFEHNRYVFDNENSIFKDPIGFINEINLIKYNTVIEKSQLITNYLICPLLLEFQIPVRSDNNNKIHLAGGIQGGLKLNSYTKIKKIESGNKFRQKIKDDYNLSPYRYGITANIGYRNMNLYASYYLSELFETIKYDSDPNLNNPKLNPFSIGIVLIPIR